ncbi:MAG TPA: TonB-dependent receptor [Saprospiraceae bacterium]|nr:TonB-dependent receptor [Saprospiraceae bacterium]
MNKTPFTLTCLLFTLMVRGQTTDTLTAKDLSEIVVTAFKEEAAITSPLNILPIKVDSLSRYGNYNLTDLLAKSPGVTMLTTGVAIAKPVIRGLYGNRVLVLLSGLKFDNQQWQEEHGLGLSDLGLQKVELIKGPMSVLYGTEAIGGLINLIEEQKPDSIGKESDYSLKFNTNTLGGLLQAGLRKNMGKNWYGLRIGIENNADYSDGNGDRVLNSRFDGYYLKAMYGFQKKNWICDNHLMSSFNRFGFIFNDVYDFIEPDDRWSRKLNEFPAHFVLLNIFSSENKIYLKDEARLTINAGVQSNLRMENEGGGRISLKMHLFTAQYLAKWEKELSKGNRLILSTLGSFENNKNYGSRKIIPDANMQEANLSIYYEMQPHSHTILEYGVSIGEKWIKTFFTPAVNGPDKEIKPFDKFEPYWNAFAGISLFPTSHFNLKFNIATGVRIPNLAELSSDGLHEGIFTYEIGDPDLKNEQNVAFNVQLDFHAGKLNFGISPFYNLFSNYVYLAPTNEEWFGFPIYRYRQQDANQYGTEAFVSADLTSEFNFKMTYSGMISKTEDGNYTPYIPAQKFVPSLTFVKKYQNARSLTIFIEAEENAPQDNVYPGEILSTSYWLLNAGASYHLPGSTTYDFGLTGHNLLNRAYVDHLSRFKYYGLYNIGLNITFYIKASW